MQGRISAEGNVVGFFRPSILVLEIISKARMEVWKKGLRDSVRKLEGRAIQRLSHYGRSN